MLPKKVVYKGSGSCGVLVLRTPPTVGPYRSLTQLKRAKLSKNIVQLKRVSIKRILKTKKWNVVFIYL